MDDWIPCVPLFRLSAWIYDQPYKQERKKQTVIQRLTYNIDFKMFILAYVLEMS